jgi:hypothetical protein
MAKRRCNDVRLGVAKTRTLAQRRGRRDRAPAPDAVDFALLADELDDALCALSDLGGIDDVFGKMPGRPGGSSDSADGEGG